MVSTEEIVAILAEVLQLDSRAKKLDSESPLLGGIPEFDSMAVVSVLTAVEDHYGLIIDDDEVSADIFETVGSLVNFVNSRFG